MRSLNAVLIIFVSIFSLSAFAQERASKKIETKYGTFTLIRPFHDGRAMHTGRISTPKGNRLLGGMCGCKINRETCEGRSFRMYHCRFEDFVEYDNELFFIMTSEVWQYDPLQDSFKTVKEFGRKYMVSKRFKNEMGTFFTLIPQNGESMFKGLLYHKDGAWKIVPYRGPKRSWMKRVSVKSVKYEGVLLIEGDDWEVTFYLDKEEFVVPCEIQTFKTSIGDFSVVSAYGERYALSRECSTLAISEMKYQTIITPEGDPVAGRPNFMHGDVIGITETPEGIFLITEDEMRRYVPGAFAKEQDEPFVNAFARVETDFGDIYLIKDFVSMDDTSFCGKAECLRTMILFYDKSQKKWIKVKYPFYVAEYYPIEVKSMQGKVIFFHSEYGKKRELSRQVIFDPVTHQCEMRNCEYDDCL